MVDRERELGKDQRRIPYQRARTPEPIHPPEILSDKKLKVFFPEGNYEFNHIPLRVTAKGIEESGIHSTGERIEAYEVDQDGNRGALRGVLSGYQGTFGIGRDQETITIDIVRIWEGGEMSTKFFTDMPGLNVRRRALALAKKRIPIAVALNMRTHAIVLASKDQERLQMDLTHLQIESGIFSYKNRKTLRRAIRVARHIRYNFTAG